MAQPNPLVWDLFQEGIKIFKEQNRRQMLIERHKKALEKLQKRSWVELYAKKLGEAFAPYFPGKTLDVCGPFGLGCQVHITFEDPNDKDYHKTLVVSPTNLDKGEIVIVDMRTPNSYPPGTLGGMSNLGHPHIPIALDTPVKDLIEYFT